MTTDTWFGHNLSSPPNHEAHMNFSAAAVLCCAIFGWLVAFAKHVQRHKICGGIIIMEIYCLHIFALFFWVVVAVFRLVLCESILECCLCGYTKKTPSHTTNTFHDNSAPRGPDNLLTCTIVFPLFTKFLLHQTFCWYFTLQISLSLLLFR